MENATRTAAQHGRGNEILGLFRFYNNLHNIYLLKSVRMEISSRINQSPDGITYYVPLRKCIHMYINV